MTIIDNDMMKDKKSSSKDYAKFLQMQRTPFRHPIRNLNSPDFNITNSHWQLRNLIQFFSLDNDYVIYPDRQQIKWLDLKTNSVHTRYTDIMQSGSYDDCSTANKNIENEEHYVASALLDSTDSNQKKDDDIFQASVLHNILSSSNNNFVGSHQSFENLTSEQSTSTSTKNNPVCKMSFSPKCFSEKDGLIVSGGLDDDVGYYNTDVTDGGVLHFFNSSTGSQFESRIGKVINNCVQLQKISPNDYRLFVCNNDKNFYLCSLNSTDVKAIRTIKLDYLLNSCGAMKNNKDIVLVSGDSNELALLDLRAKTKKKNSGVQTINALTYPKDCGFSVDFHSSDIYFASAFQGGKTFIFDIRNTKSHIHHIESVRYHQESTQVYVSSYDDINNEYAFRHLKFSDNRKSVDDYLFVTEHKSRLHVLDMRNFENHTITYFPNNTKKSVKVIKAKDYYTSGVPDDRSIYEINGLDWTGQFGENSKLIVGGMKNARLFEIDSSKRMLFQNYQLC